jgi:hypothetical protein
LIRRAVEFDYESRKGVRPADDLTVFRNDLEEALNRLGIGDLARDGWVAFLTRSNPQNQYDPEILRLATITSGQGVDRHLAVLSRSILLMRVATGICANSLQIAGLLSTDIEAWLESESIGRGLTDTPVDPWEDLYADVREALDELGNWVSERGAGFKLLEWRSYMGSQLSVLTGAERVAVWGLST